MYIMGKIKSRSTGSVSSRHDAKRQRYEYSFDDREVCKDAFLFLQDIGKKYLKNLLKHMKTNGIRPRTNGNSGKKPHNFLKKSSSWCSSLIDILRIMAFLCRLLQELPTLLTCLTSKRDIHNMYAEACQEVSIHAVKLSSFLFHLVCMFT